MTAKQARDLATNHRPFIERMMKYILKEIELSSLALNKETKYTTYGRFKDAKEVREEVQRQLIVMGYGVCYKFVHPYSIFYIYSAPRPMSEWHKKSRLYKFFFRMFYSVSYYYN